MTQIAVKNQIWNYELIGDGFGRPQESPLLILHGWGRLGKEWTGLAQDLSKRTMRKIYILDLPGFGGSSLPSVATISQYSQLVRAFCDYLKLDKVVVVGHSLGGRVGIVLASKPGLVKKLILVDPAGVKSRSIMRVVLGVLAKLFAWVPKGWRDKMLGLVMDEDYRNSPALRDLYRAVVAQDLSIYLPKIEVETVVVWGENDPILPLSLTKKYRKMLGSSQIRVVWGAGHDPHLTHYAQTLSILEESIND